MAEQTDERRAEPRSQGSPWGQAWLGAALVLASILTIAGTVWASADGKLSPLESTLFAAVTFILSSVGAVLISAYFSRGQARQEYQQLARPALRRIAALHVSTDRVNEYIGHRITVTDERDRDWLLGLTAQMQLLLDQMGAAVSDWRKLLPEDYEEVRENAVAVQQLAAKVAELERLRASEDQERAQGDGNARARIDELTRDIDALKKKVAANSATGAGTLSINTDSSPMFVNTSGRMFRLKPPLDDSILPPGYTWINSSKPEVSSTKAEGEPNSAAGK